MQDPDGSWRLTAYYGYDTGKRISLAFNQMVRTYRNRVAVNGIDRTNSGTPQQRRADASANLITGEGPHNRPDTTLLVIADYDTVTRELHNLRYDGAMPVPADQIAKLAAQAKILPAIFNTDGDPLWLGRAARDASAGQRIALAARDGGCVNCAAPAEGGEPHPHRNGSAEAGPPTSATSRCCANAATTSYTTTDGNCHRHNGQLRLRPPAPRSTPNPSPARHAPPE